MGMSTTLKIVSMHPLPKQAKHVVFSNIVDSLANNVLCLNQNSIMLPLPLPCSLQPWQLNGFIVCPLEAIVSEKGAV